MYRVPPGRVLTLIADAPPEKVQLTNPAVAKMKYISPKVGRNHLEVTAASSGTALIMVERPDGTYDRFRIDVDPKYSMDDPDFGLVHQLRVGKTYTLPLGFADVRTQSVDDPTVVSIEVKHEPEGSWIDVKALKPGSTTVRAEPVAQNVERFEIDVLVEK